jgi:hypothetical protein
VLPLTAVAGVITDASEHDDTLRRLRTANIPIIHA